MTALADREHETGARGQMIRERWSRGALVSLVIWTAAHLVIYIDAIITHRLVHPADFTKPGWFFGLFAHWDSVQFIGVASHGYFGPGLASPWQAYFPGYPIAIRAAATLLYGATPDIAHLTVAAWLISLVGSYLATVLFWRIAADRLTRQRAVAATVLLSFGAYAHFLIASYSESLFLVFALAAWLSASRGRWLAAGLFAAAATFTRANGIFVVAALVVLLAFELHRQRRPIVWRTFLMAAVGAAGVGVFFGYLYANTGDPLAWSHAQYVGWGRVTQWPWRTLRRTIGEAVATGSPFHTQYVLDLLFAVLVVVGFVFLVIRRWWAEAVYVGLTALSLMTSLSYLSLARSTVLLFPLSLLVATALGSRRTAWIYWVVLAGGCVLLLYNTSQFTLGLWSD
jgi:hypothetical protein